jgi:hypothetical protein
MSSPQPLVETDVENSLRWGELTELGVRDLDCATPMLTVSRAVVRVDPSSTRRAVASWRSPNPSLAPRGAPSAPLPARHAEAEEAAARLGDDLNLRWTARVAPRPHRRRPGSRGHGDRRRRTVDLGRIDVTERKASFLMDTARAFLQCGRHEPAYLALRAGEEIAPEEITGRPAARRLVRDLMTTALFSVQRQAEDFARRVGVTE